MPRMRACPKCGVKRLIGGKSPDARLCLDCYRGSLRSRTSQKQQYRCSNNCGRKVSGPKRTCQPCWGMKLRAKKLIEGSGVPALKACDVAPPADSWWTEPDFSAAFQKQLTRFQVGGIGRDRPPIGMSMTTYNG